MLALLIATASGLLGLGWRLGFTGAPAASEVPDPLEALEAPVRGFITRGLLPGIGHYGIDVALPEGSPVRAVASGRVLLADSLHEGGLTLVVVHASGLTTLYAHNSRLLVRAGDAVKAGQTIALSGNTGRLSTGPHLHVEAWQGEVPLDLTPKVSADSSLR